MNKGIQVNCTGYRWVRVKCSDGDMRAYASIDEENWVDITDYADEET